MKRRVLSIVVIVLTLGVLTFIAFYHISARKTSDQTPISKGKTTLRFWYTDDSLTDVLNAVAVAYSEENKNNVRVEMVLTEEADLLDNVYQASVHPDEETAPADLYLITNDTLEKAYLSGVAAEVTDDIFAGISDVEQGARSAVTYNGKVVAYPFFYETTTLLYNATYLEQHAIRALRNELVDAEDAEETSGGETEEVQFTQEQINKKALELLPTTIPLLEDFANDYDAPEGVEAVMEWPVSDVLYNMGFAGDAMSVGGVNGDDGDAIDIANTATIEALTAFQELNQFFSFGSNDLEYEQVLQRFMEGKIVMTVVSTDALSEMADAFADGTFQNGYGFGLIPAINETAVSRPLSITSVVAVNGFSDHPDEAADFAKYLTQSSADLFEERTDLLTVYGESNLPGEDVFRMSYNNSMAIPKMMSTGNFWVQMEIAFTRIWEGEDVAAVLYDLSNDLERQRTQ